jgi:hypothetical protein
LRSVVGRCVSLFLTKLYGKWGVAWTFTLLATNAYVLARVPWICYWYGDK